MLKIHEVCQYIVCIQPGYVWLYVSMRWKNIDAYELFHYIILLYYVLLGLLGQQMKY